MDFALEDIGVLLLLVDAADATTLAVTGLTSADLAVEIPLKNGTNLLN